MTLPTNETALYAAHVAGALVFAILAVIVAVAGVVS